MEELDLWDLLASLLRRAWAIVLVAILGGVIAFGYTYYMITPMYKASTLLYVNNASLTVGSQSVSITASQLSTAQRLVDTYIVILKSRSVLNDVIEAGDLPYSYDSLRGMISSEAVNETEVFQVVVTCSDPQMAEHIANTIAEILPDKIADIMAGSDVRIVDYAVVPAGRSSPSYTRNTTMGLLIGGAVCAAFLVLLYLLDDQIHSEEYLTQNFPDIPLLSVIPDMAPGRSRSGGYYSARYYRRDYYGRYRNSYQSAAPREKEAGK